MKTLLAIFFSLTCLSAMGQTAKGTWMLGGSAGLSSQTNTVSFTGSDFETKTKSASFAPNIGLFVADRFATGVIFNFSKTDLEFPDHGAGVQTSSFGLGPSLRYYFPVGEKFALFPRLSYVYQTNFIKERFFNGNSGDFFEETRKSNSSTINIGGGLSWFLTRSIGAEAIVNYNAYGSDGSNTSKTLSFNLGFQIYFSNNTEQ